MWASIDEGIWLSLQSHHMGQKQSHGKKNSELKTLF
jgi:hypothetical protein